MGIFDLFKRKKPPVEAPAPKPAPQPAPQPAPKPAPQPAPKPAPQPALKPASEPAPVSKWKAASLTTPAPESRPQVIPLKADILDGPTLKKRLIEWDINWSDERLTPYFDEALLSARESDDPSVLFWACKSLSELLRISSDGFRKRIGEIVATEKVRNLVALNQLDYIRYTQPDHWTVPIMIENLKALTGTEMTEEIKDARRYNAAWIEYTKKVGNYPGSMSRSERDRFEKDVFAICARLNCCSAVSQLVGITVQLMKAVQSARQMGNIVYHETIDLKTGQREIHDSPDIYRTEDFGFNMIAALPKDVLQQCLDGQDFAIDQGAHDSNYDVMLKKAVSRAGLT